MATTTRSTVWVDITGATRQTILRGSATLAPVQAQLISFSLSDYQAAWESATILNGAPTPTPGTYQAVGDYAVLVFRTATGNLVYITLPAPKASVFLADGETVDAVAIATLITAVLAVVTDVAGNAVTSFVGGFRRARLREYQ